jgi:glycosyltransferase involved in cell wall biosynthesis
MRLTHDPRPSNGGLNRAAAALTKKQEERQAITIIIPTLNEELHIERAVRSALSLGPVFVVDSLSTDGTRKVAESAGATVVEHPWQGYAEQKNWALDNLPITTSWVLFLDADETITPDLQNALTEATTRDADAWYLPRENILLGRPLKHVWWYPDYQLRLFRNGSARYEDRRVHEHMVVSGTCGYLGMPIIHENIKGMSAFIERHQRYAALEAREIRRTLRTHVERKSLASRKQQLRDAALIIVDRAARRRFLKERVWYKMPYRPAIRFLWLYLGRRGFLDGRHGLVYAGLIGAYEAMIDAYLLELEYQSDESHELEAK